jgi:hypothetical protein
LFRVVPGAEPVPQQWCKFRYSGAASDLDALDTTNILSNYVE